MVHSKIIAMRTVVELSQKKKHTTIWRASVNTAKVLNSCIDLWEKDRSTHVEQTGFIAPSGALFLSLLSTL